MDRKLLFSIIEGECIRQDEKWGVQEHSDGKWSLIFDEEKGEFAEAVLEGEDDKANGELIQCAAVLVQWLLTRFNR